MHKAFVERFCFSTEFSTGARHLILMADEPNNQPNPQPTPPQTNPAESYQRLLGKYNNDAGELALKLFGENFDLREEKRQLKDKLPKEGSVVLTADEAKLFKAYQDLGIEPKDLKKAIDRLPELEKSNKELASMETLRELADVGLDGSKLKLSVLKDQIARFPDAAISFRTEKDKDGKESKAAFIKTTADAAEVSFNDFAAQNLSDYLPALKVNAEQPQVTPQPGNSHDPKPAGLSPDNEAAKLAQNGQARATHNAF
jgi:hypothetical protein